MTTLVFVTALGCGVAAGTFFAFSSFVMNGLGRLPAAQAIRAMNEINVTAVTPVFMIELFGTALACLAVLVTGWGDGYLMAGALTYLLGAILTTIVFHVPRNNALAAQDPEAPDAADRWARYLRDWTAGNHVRTLAALAASAFLIGGLLA